MVTIGDSDAVFGKSKWSPSVTLANKNASGECYVFGVSVDQRLPVDLHSVYLRNLGCHDLADL